MTALAAVPDVPTSTDFDAGYIARGRELVQAGESTSWDMGDYILEAFPIGTQGVASGLAAGIRALAAEIGGEPESLTQHRKVAHGWPKGTRVPFATWSAHRALMGSPSDAPARRKVLESLPRNEHGIVTKKAVRDLTKGNTSGKPGWHELIGRVGDALTAAEKHLAAAEAAIDRQPSEDLCNKAGVFADRAAAIVERLREIECM